MVEKEDMIKILSEVRDALSDAGNCAEAADFLDDRINALKKVE